MSFQVVTTLLCAALVSAPPRASLDIDASALGEMGPALASRLTTRGEGVLRDGDVLPGHSPDDALITVRIDSLPDAVGYRYSYTVTRSGELVEGTRGAAECRLCSEAELAAQLDEALAALVGKLQPSEAPPPPAAVTVAPVATSPQPSTPRWQVSPIGAAGIALTGVGGLALGLGSGLAIAEPVLLEGNAKRNSTVSVAGLAVAVTGAALAASGVAMMLVDRGRSRRKTTARWRGATLRF